jgi:hydroxymethylbilane synthase
MSKIIRIGTRDSQLAVWQATLVQNLLKDAGIASELVYIKSEGDVDTVTPLYAMGVQGVFTKTLDAALLSNRIDIAVHSMKDVPTQLAKGIQQAAVLKRASYKDIFVAHPDAPLRLPPVGEAISAQPSHKLAHEKILDAYLSEVSAAGGPSHREGSGMGRLLIATSSIRRKAQWLNRYPNHTIENLRGNVNTRLRKLAESNWSGAIFAAAGLERINLRPEKSVDLDWMLPAPAQGAIMIVCREEDDAALESCQTFNDEHTALCTKIERDFLNTLMGGCSTPISALAEVRNDIVQFEGNICTPDGRIKTEIKKEFSLENAATAGVRLANELLQQPSASKIVQDIRYAKK